MRNLWYNHRGRIVAFMAILVAILATITGIIVYRCFHKTKNVDTEQSVAERVNYYGYGDEVLANDTLTNENQAKENVTSESVADDYACCTNHNEECGIQKDADGNVIYCCYECPYIETGHNANCGIMNSEGQVSYCSEDCPYLNKELCDCGSHNVYCGITDEIGIHFCCTHCPRIPGNGAPSLVLNGDNYGVIIISPYESDMAIVNAPIAQNSGTVTQNNTYSAATATSKKNVKSTSTPTANATVSSTPQKTATTQKAAAAKSTTPTSTTSKTATPKTNPVQTSVQTAPKQPVQTPVVQEPVQAPTVQEPPKQESEPIQAPVLQQAEPQRAPTLRSGGQRADNADNDRNTSSSKASVNMAKTEGYSQEVGFTITGYQRGDDIEVKGGTLKGGKQTADGVYHGTVELDEGSSKVTVTVNDRNGNKKASEKSNYEVKEDEVNWPDLNTPDYFEEQ